MLITMRLGVLAAAAVVGVATMALLLVSPTPAAAQGAVGPPTEPTISQLREGLQNLLEMERQRQLLGLESTADVSAAALTLLTREFDEQVLPGLQSVVDDCFFAEIPLQRAVQWARQVQLLGIAEEFGPLYEQTRVTMDLTIEILKNCHDELYRTCVLNDADPGLDVLGGLTRQLALFGVESGPNGSYQERWLRCEVGWHGTLRVTERVAGTSRLQMPSAPGTSVVATQDIGGSREVTIELPNKKQPATGKAQGRIVHSNRQETVTPNCRETLVNEHETAAGGEGEAALRKGGDLGGTVILNFSGPMETGYSRIGGQNTSSCGGSGALPTRELPFPSGAWRGLLSENMGDPNAEVLAGTKTLTFVAGAADSAGGGMGQSGGAFGMPAIPGMPSIPGMSGAASFALPGEAANPWLLGQVEPGLGQSPGDGPTVTMTITWNLTFG